MSFIILFNNFSQLSNKITDWRNRTQNKRSILNKKNIVTHSEYVVPFSREAICHRNTSRNNKLISTHLKKKVYLFFFDEKSHNLKLYLEKYKKNIGVCHWML